ncbi:MAG: 50S ribosomal protein L9 [Acidobacteria bacterium]|nr:50S ribosomal protein L9 [Acidobacteriota bacterium]
MKVILTDTVDGLGGKGDVVEVADGYARNYLVPKSKAIKATRGALKEADVLRRSRVEAERVEKAAASQIAEALADSRVVVAVRSAEEGKLFGSIGARNVADAIAQYTGVQVEPQIIMLTGPIKEIGLYEVTLKPHPEVEFQLTLDVIPS